MSDFNIDKEYMQRALVLAREAADQGEVPVGAIVVLNNQIIGQGYNQSISAKDPTAHAEIIALREAAKTVGNYRLLDATLYVTLEPCLMCVGAMVHARILRVVFGAHDPKTGAAESVGRFFELPHWNHRVEMTGGVLSEPCCTVLTQFFKALRAEASEKK